MMQASRKRVRLSWHPTWTPQIEKWTAWQIQKNLWRFDRAEDVDDIMQDAHLLWVKLERKYPIVNEAAHFVALYKTSLSRMFLDKVKRKSRSISSFPTEELTEELSLEGMPNLGHLNLLLEEIPDELKSVLRALTTGRVRLKLDRPPPKKPRPRENFNMRLKRQLSLGMDDPVGELRSYFINS